MTESTVNASNFSARADAITIAHRPVIDILIERLTKKLIAWSERRAKKNQLTHHRMALIHENEPNATRGGSPIAR